MVLAGVCMACAMYSYPPTRLQAPLIVLLLIGYQIKQKRITLKSLGMFFGVMLLCCVPLVWGTLKGPLLDRFNSISILSTTSSLPDFLWTFIKNYGCHLTPQYLFLTGDRNYRHSTGHFGQLSWLDMLGLVTGLALLIILWKKQKRPSHLVIFLLMAAASGVLPAALTWGRTAQCAAFLWGTTFHGTADRIFLGPSHPTLAWHPDRGLSHRSYLRNQLSSGVFHDLPRRQRRFLPVGPASGRLKAAKQKKTG